MNFAEDFHQYKTGEFICNWGRYLYGRKDSVAAVIDQAEPAFRKGSRFGQSVNQLGEVLFKERNCPVPGKLCLCFVVPGSGIVVKSVACAVIGVHDEFLAIVLQSFSVVGLAGVHPWIILGVLDHQRCLDLDYIFRFRGTAVKGNPGVQITTHNHRQLVDHAAAVTESRCSEFAR